jgi:glutamine cyclotransferase
VRIDPATGLVQGWIDLDALVPADKRGSEADVMNGIAWDPATGHFFVTGKRWPVVYEVKFTQGVGSGE